MSLTNKLKYRNKKEISINNKRRVEINRNRRKYTYIIRDERIRK
jgi:hypothetical protein